MTIIRQVESNEGGEKNCEKCAAFHCIFNKTKIEDLPSNKDEEGEIETYGCRLITVRI